MNSKSHSIQAWQHQHQFANINNDGERNTRYVLYLTLITMIAEIASGTIYGSMALLADGWHMGTHAAAFMITLFAYRYAKKHANNPNFTFGTGKVSVLGGFTSAIALGLVALIMLVESAVRIFNPQQIQFNEAIMVALIGLTVNVISVFLLKDHHSHDHGHGHGHSHHDHSHHDHSHHDHSHHESHTSEQTDPSKGHHDHNLRAAYFHVLADALTSILAICALLLGKLYGLNWLDPVMGIVGSVIISRWAWNLLRQTAPILLDTSIEDKYKNMIVSEIESEEDHQIADLHIWRVSADHYAVALSLVSHKPKDADYFKSKLKKFDRLSHFTIELNTCRQAECT